MGIEMKFVTFFVVLAVFVLVQETDAATYVVGDSLGWTIPSGGAAAYATWAAKNTYAPGDVLVFNFAVGVHDVATVTKTSYDSCSSNGALSLSTVSPTNITLTTAGTYYFICTFGQHCSFGQKLTLTVTSAATTPPTAPPTSAVTPPTASAKPPTTATSPPTAGSLTPATATKPPTAATPAAGTTIGTPALPPAAATMPPTTAPTPAPTGMTPTATSPAPEGGAPAPGPGTGAGGVPSTGSPAPTGDSASPPAPGSASRKGVAPLTIGFVLVVMGVVF